MIRFHAVWGQFQAPRTVQSRRKLLRLPQAYNPAPEARDAHGVRRRLGPYEMESLIGVGGMGEVYRARDARLDRTVALEVLPSGLGRDAEYRARFEREARPIASLNHRHPARRWPGRGYLT